MTPPVFSFQSYRDYLKARINGEEGNWGILTKLAKAAGCQRPYLSRVLAGDAQLTPAQGFGLSRYWGHSEEEREYFLTLLEAERAGSADYREYLSRKIEDARKRHENISRLVSRKVSVNSDRDLTYYSAWYWTAVHILVSIPEFQSEKKISEKLNMPLTQVRMILAELEAWGAVKKEGAKWLFQSGEQHISKDSPLAVFHHNNWRQQAMVNAQRRDPQSLHFTVVQSLSEADFEKVRHLLLATIEKAAEIAGPSKEEKLICLNLDFFEP